MGNISKKPFFLIIDFNFGWRIQRLLQNNHLFFDFLHTNQKEKNNTFYASSDQSCSDEQSGLWWFNNNKHLEEFSEAAQVKYL